MLFLLLFGLFEVSVTAAESAMPSDWAGFVAASDRSDDGLIMDVLKEADFETSVQMCTALAARKDPYAQDILLWMLSLFSKTAEYKTETRLRITMKAFFDDAPSPKVKQERIVANADFIDQLVKHVTRFRDPQLRDDVVRLLPSLPEQGRLSALMDVGSGLIDALKQADGRLSVSDTGLAYDYLALVQKIGNSDFMEPCLTISRLSRDSELTKKSRQVAISLTETSK